MTPETPARDLSARDLSARDLDVDRLARELGNWRTASSSGPVYQGLADGIRMLIVDGRLPIGARLPSERALADRLRVSRTTVTSAYAQLREDGYLLARRGARSTTALPATLNAPVPPVAARGAVNLANAALAAPAPAVLAALTTATQQMAPYLDDTGIELVGVPSLREAVAAEYCARGLPTEPDDIMITTGALHAIGLILATYTQPGDRVLVEQPTYHGALAAIATAGGRPVPVAIAEDGWDLVAVHTVIRQLAPTLAYLVPDNHNPTGRTMRLQQRRELAALIADTGTRTIIDETMTEVWLDEPVPPPVATAMTRRRDLLLTTGSMSKSFWGGLRIGWIRADQATLASIAALRPSIDMGTPILEQLAAAELLRGGAEVLPERRELLRTRRARMLSLLAERLPDWQPCPGGGGLALWMRLPAPMSSALSAAASRMGLDVPPGPRFGVDGSLERFIRIPYTLPPEQMTEAVTLLARAWHAVTGAAASQRVVVV
ncbi:PLP-dependent aminotransferase family protein [Mycolicibacterium doricum]|uniref:GntR family transcriptional regulator n=2 Tax=Mycolicibacterium doricum TaxID=126673 RepID=A0A1X1TFX8_9MYCO|nr:PLP-dependent aminotransferase family protein [Mycolicibacterium doricum]ORV43474.1 GntR family transcriptional regulator [Mycolicibacterium doricum]